MLLTKLRVCMYVSIFGRDRNGSYFFSMFLLTEELFQMRFTFFFPNQIIQLSTQSTFHYFSVFLH